MRSFLLSLVIAVSLLTQTAVAAPVGVAIVGLTHDHVFWLLHRPRNRGDVEIVGVYETDAELAAKRMNDAGLGDVPRYNDLGRLLAETQPDAACLFGSIRDHHEQAIQCAEAGVHVMVEKPLALNLAAAREMADAAARAGVVLLTNYETTWYPSVHELQRRVVSGDLGAIRRMNFRMGHFGPVEIGCRQPFLKWLLDPAENGAGALTDFGCYGANLATWLTQGERPVAVTCVTKQHKPAVYADVDDDATITIEYPSSVAIVQASWCWPDHIKEVRVYTERGDLQTIDSEGLTVRPRGFGPETISPASPMPPRESDPFTHLAAVVRGKTAPNALSSVENNLVVMEVLDAARRSAETGERVTLGP